MSLGFGDHVVIDRDGTTVVQGPDDEIARKVRIPDWGGYSEWVTPEEVDGRHILETCFKHDLPGEVHSYKVANWRQHPNFAVAEAMGLPTAIWSETGQSTIESSGDAWWLASQLKAIESVLLRQGIADIVARLKGDAQGQPVNPGRPVTPVR